jgi:type I restriction enzyme, S subunit
MKSLVKCRLGDALTLKRGYDLPKNMRVKGDCPIVSSSGITGFHNIAKVKGPGVVTGRYGTLGEVFYISSDFWPLNTSLYVKDFKGNNKKFIASLLKIYLSANQNAAGAVPGVNRNHLHKIQVILPSLPVQNKIAAILSAYDDLIENNNRRIAILEKMAEELYREWFVRMRFPGHEKAKIIKGIPEGWGIKSVEQLINRIPVGKKYEEKTVGIEGEIPVLDQGQSGIIGYHNDEPGVVASLLSPVIVFANHTCYQRLVFHPFSAIQNVLPFIPNEEISSNVIWLHYATKRLIEFSEYKGHWPEFIKKYLYFPGTTLTATFGNIIQPIVATIYKTELSISTLKKIRDQLLSRLMSGKLDVEKLDIRFPKSMLEEELESVSA